MSVRRDYAVATVVLFTIEVIIALYVRDWLIRPYGGDAIAVALVYCAIRAVTPLRAVTAVAIAFGIAVLVELGQWIGLLDMLGLSGNRLARIVLGHGFEWKDFTAYGAGALAVLLI